MSSAIMNSLINHVLILVENELVKHEADIAHALIRDVQALIVKLESLIAKKLPKSNKGGQHD